MAPTPYRRALALFALAVLAPLGLAACGDDDDDAATDTTAAVTDTTGDSASGDVEEYCEATLAIETVEEPDIDFESLTPEQQAEEAKKFAKESLRPLADRIREAAPEEVADDIAVLHAAVVEIEETGNFEAFETPENEAASDRAHAFDLENCGWTEQAVTMVDYDFEGVPASLEAGAVSFEATNSGNEVHEMILLKKNAGVTESFEDLLALPEEEAMTKVTFVAAGFAPPGEDDYTVTELEAGEYGMACFIPLGTVSEDAAEEAEGPPHFTQGMFAEFTVS
jgi:hypothetical protein